MLFLFQQMEEQFKTLIVLSHYLEVCIWLDYCIYVEQLVG